MSYEIWTNEYTGSSHQGALPQSSADTITEMAMSAASAIKQSH
jgi:hypothetical protein